MPCHIEKAHIPAGCVKLLSHTPLRCFILHEKAIMSGHPAAGLRFRRQDFVPKQQLITCVSDTRAAMSMMGSAVKVCCCDIIEKANHQSLTGQGWRSTLRYISLKPFLGISVHLYIGRRSWWTTSGPVLNCSIRIRPRGHVPQGATHVRHFILQVLKFLEAMSVR